MKITLRQISWRLLTRYYPIWLLINVLMSYNLLRFLKWMPGVGLAQNIVGGQIVNILMYLFILIPLYILKPIGFLSRLVTMVIAMLVAVVSCYSFTVAGYAQYPEFFGGHEAPLQLLLFQTVIGIFTIWFFVLAERSLLAEKELAKEETKRLSYEKKLLGNRLKILQAQIEPQMLLRTMKTIEGLYDTDPKMATSMQLRFIQYLRATLVKTRVAAATVAQEMDLIRGYIDLYGVSTGKKLKCRFVVDPETRALSFPSLLIQPVVQYRFENGLGADSKEAEMTISVQKRAQTLQVKISDSGSCHVGNIDLESNLSLVKNRLFSLFGDKGRLLLRHNPCSMVIEVPHGDD